MSKEKQKLTVFEAACIITGYGIGAGALAIPRFVQKNGIAVSAVIIIAAFAASWLMHMLIAELAMKNGGDSQIVSVFSRFLFRGKYKKVLTGLFFALMACVLISNLAAYISGSGEIISELLHMPEKASELIFYAAAALVVLFGLKTVGVSEKYAVCAIFAVVAVLAVASFTAEMKPLPLKAGSIGDGLSLFSMAMFAFSAFFSVPQAVKGLEGDGKKIRKAVTLGLSNVLILLVVISLCANLASTEVTEVAMVGWSEGIGTWAQIAGSIFTVLAMLTTYWSVSLSLAEMVGEQFQVNQKLCWLAATLPSFILAVFSTGGFLDLLSVAAGAIALIVALLFVPAFRNAAREVPQRYVGAPDSTAVLIITAFFYLLMAVGSVI